MISNALSVKENKNDLATQLYMFIFALYLSLTMVSTSFFYRGNVVFVTRILILCCIGLIVIKELIEKKFDNKFFLGVVTFLPLFLLMYKSSGVIAATSMIVLFSSRNSDFHHLIKEATIVCAVLLIVIILSAKLGLILNYVSQGPRIRHYLGFRYSLFAPAILFNITAGYLYTRSNKVTIYEIFLLTVVNCWLYKQSNSNLSFILAIILILLVMVNKFWGFEKLHFQRLVLFKWIYPICGLISFLFVQLYYAGNSVAMTVNSILENRIGLASISLSKFGVHLLGSGVKWVGNGLKANGQSQVLPYLYVDNFYINVLQSKGIIFFLVFMVLFSLVIIDAYKRKDYLLVVIMVIYALHGLVDDLMFTYYYNMFILAVSTNLFSSVDGKSKLNKSISSNSERVISNPNKDFVKYVVLP